MPACIGTNTNCTVQDCPGCKTPQFVLATLNPVSALTLVSANWYLVLLVTVSVCMALTEPMLCVPKPKYPELSVIVPVLLRLHAGTTKAEASIRSAIVDVFVTPLSP